MDRAVTSDIHLGHKLVAELRGFSSVEEHDNAVIDSLTRLPRKCKLWVMGDIAFSWEALSRLREIRARTVVAVLGNHDMFPISSYIEVFDDVIGPRKYKSLWMSHFPIHPQELYRVRGNVHGHIHKNAATLPLEDPRYFNVNWDFHRGPVMWDQIEAHYTAHGLGRSIDG